MLTAAPPDERATRGRALKKRPMTKHNVTLRLTATELARDPHAILIRVRDEGLEVIVEEEERALALIKAI